MDLISQQNQYQNNSDIYSEKEKMIFTSSFELYDFYREKNEITNRKIFFWRQDNQLLVPVKIYGNNIVLSASSQTVKKKFDYKINKIESFKISHESNRYTFGITIYLWKKYLYISSGIGSRFQNNNSLYPWHLGAGLLIFDQTSLTYRKYYDFFQWNYSLGFENPVINLFVSEHSLLDEFEFKTKIFKGLYFTACTKNNMINYKSGKTEITKYFRPNGTRYRRNFSLEFTNLKNWIFDFSYSSRESNISGHFYDSGQTFGKLTESIEKNEYFKPGIIFSKGNYKIGLNYSWGNGSFDNRGHIESWPFTSTWIDLLGLRYYFKSNIEYNFKRYYAHFKYSNRTWAFSTNTIFENLDTFGDTRTWEPLFLVFGIQNLKVYELSYSSFKGIYQNINLSLTITKNLIINYCFNQYIPFEIEKKASNISNKKSNTRGSVYGGGQHVVKLHIYF